MTPSVCPWRRRWHWISLASVTSFRFSFHPHENITASFARPPRSFRPGRFRCRLLRQFAFRRRTASRCPVSGSRSCPSPPARSRWKARETEKIDRPPDARDHLETVLARADGGHARPVEGADGHRCRRTGVPTTGGGHARRNAEQQSRRDGVIGPTGETRTTRFRTRRTMPQCIR